MLHNCVNNPYIAICYGVVIGKNGGDWSEILELFKKNAKTKKNKTRHCQLCKKFCKFYQPSSNSLPNHFVDFYHQLLSIEAAAMFSVSLPTKNE